MPDGPQAAEQMKILTLVWSIGQGGTERAAVNYAIGYKKFGHESKVLVLGNGHQRYQELVTAGIETTLLVDQKNEEQKIIAGFAHWQPDIIHIHNFHELLLPYIRAIKGSHAKLVETNVFSRPCFSKNYSLVDLSLQLSNWGYWKYSNWMKGAAFTPQIAVVPYIVDEEKFEDPGKEAVEKFLRSLDIPAGAFVAGRLGQAQLFKWDERYIKIIRETALPGNSIYYILAGVPDSIVELIKKESEFLQSRIKLIERIEGDAKLSLYYHSLDCFVHLSRIGESFGYVLTEAMLCRVPVITMLTPFKDNAQFEVVGHLHGGVCVTGTGSFIKAVLELYHNKAGLLSLKNNLGNWVQQRFSYNAVMPGLIDTLEKISAGKPLPGLKNNAPVKEVMKLYGAKAFFIERFTRMINSRYAYKAAHFFKR